MTNDIEHRAFWQPEQEPENNVLGVVCVIIAWVIAVIWFMYPSS